MILTDVRMPKLDGPGLYRELAERRPELLSRLIFVTGDTLGRATREFLASVAAPAMTKPFDVKELRTRVTDEKSPIYRYGKRAYFVIDRRGTVRYMKVMPNPLDLLNPDEVLEALKAAGS